jgi:hypothetical protein
MYFVYVYENGTMKSVEIILRMGKGGLMERVSLLNIHYKHICKCHIETPLYN